MRFFGGLAFISAVGYSLLQVTNLEIPAFTFIAALAFGVIYCSFGEWLTRGMLYQAPLPGLKKIHTTQLTFWSQNLLAIAVGVPVIMAPTFLMTDNSLFHWTVVGTVCFIACFMTYVHRVIHTPRGRLIERQKWFLWLDRHHYIHHIDITANINFLLPICDFVFGTQKWNLTDEELARHPSFEQAKPMAYDVNPALNLSLADKIWTIDSDLAAAADAVEARGAPLGASMSIAPLDSYAGMGGNPNIMNGSCLAESPTIQNPPPFLNRES
ncbi:MAG: hypothetical protein JST80_03640 [Bdellovibrionales bacterium]|nr:hypothetical protein [Bdellovibrionales bacterium]